MIRTLPNTRSKFSQRWSGANPPYFEAAALEYLRELGIEHLLVDLPSVDREEDGGALAAHHLWWNYPEAPRMAASISEMIFVQDSVVDGDYLLNLQIASLETDASPSKPILYEFEDWICHTVNNHKPSARMHLPWLHGDAGTYSIQIIRQKLTQSGHTLGAFMCAA